jgi:hypothetical protein
LLVVHQKDLSQLKLASRSLQHVVGYAGQKCV